MKRVKDAKFTLKRSFSLMSMVGVSMCVIIFTVVQFIFMDDIYAFAAKLMLLKSSHDITAMDFSDNSYLPKLSDYEANNGIYVEIYSPRNVLFYTTNDNSSVYLGENTNENKTLTPRYMKILSHSDQDDGSFFEIREEAFASAQYIVYGSFFGETNSLLIYYPIDSITENAQTASWALFALSIIALIIYFFVVFCFAVAFTKPLEIISKTTKNISNLDFSQNCPNFKIKELDELSSSINVLSSSLENALNDLKNENRQLERDILKERALDKSRRTFVANASHELKTPISIIQGYAEGMKYGIGCDSTEEFCDIIIEEAGKMNELVVTLMQFIHYGTKYQPNYETFNLNSIIMSNLLSFELKLKENGITAVCEIPPDISCQGDKSLVNVVLNNYISNAISHCAYDKKIIINVTEHETSYKISIFNTGNPIPDADIENIWQSFYRADKSHSRKDGHFGLGLSIVSSIQQLHNADCGAINKDDGVEFWFDVKKA